MTKEEKIKGLYNLKEYLMKNPIELEGYKSLPITLIDYAIEALEQEPKTEWISGLEWTPASDPPKQSGRYLVYIVNEFDEKLQYQMTADYIARPTPIEGLSPWYVDDECASDNVVAWRPLPEDYKAEKGGEE